MPPVSQSRNEQPVSVSPALVELVIDVVEPLLVPEVLSVEPLLDVVGSPVVELDPLVSVSASVSEAFGLQANESASKALANSTDPGACSVIVIATVPEDRSGPLHLRTDEPSRVDARSPAISPKP
jgi:hypothetical protein